MGDFNEIIYPFEKEGGNPRPNHFMQAFRDVLSDWSLNDIGFHGDKFTWHRAGIRERLDRGLASASWQEKFDDALVHNLEYSRSDHRPILLSFGEAPAQERRGPAVLRFEARWLKEDAFHEVVEGAWEASNYQVQTNGLAGRLSMVHERLHNWDRNVLKSPQRKLKNAKNELESLTRREISEENIAREKELAAEIEKLLLQEGNSPCYPGDE